MKVHITQRDHEGKGVIVSWPHRDLDQIHDSNRTLTQYELNPMKEQTVLFFGDLSYADDSPFHANNRWDTGYMGEGESKPFKPYTTRYFLLYEASCSISPLWYSIEKASAYILFLSSYSAYGKYAPRYKWLEKELPKVNKTVTPWFIVLMHSHFPLYNSYVHHYMEGESFRVMYEEWFVEYKVDDVFPGHDDMNGYQMLPTTFRRLCTLISDQSAPVYITIGAGGNLKGLVTEMSEPQPSYSAFRPGS